MWGVWFGGLVYMCDGLTADLFAKPVRVLAPMEGLTDPLMRQILTFIAKKLDTHYDWAVSEFIRVTHYPIPAHVFYKFVPELYNHGKTKSGTPVHIQLLGNNIESMTQSAMTAVDLGAKAIDLNFGCPAKTVNNHKGGAVLLDEPETIFKIIWAIRRAVPKNIPVSAKIRLGYRDDTNLHNIGQAVKEGGANWLTVHARTKVQGYRPPAHWDKIASLSDLGIPIIANGEIWSKTDSDNCAMQANTPHIMLGRGAVTYPDLIGQINSNQRLTWQQLLDYQLMFLEAHTDNLSGMIGRYKQWLGMMRGGYLQADCLWQTIKRQQNKDDIIQFLKMQIKEE